jgi:hypothetical protein
MQVLHRVTSDIQSEHHASSLRTPLSLMLAAFRTAAAQSAGVGAETGHCDRADDDEHRANAESKAAAMQISDLVFLRLGHMAALPSAITRQCPSLPAAGRAVTVPSRSTWTRAPAGTMAKR